MLGLKEMLGIFSDPHRKTFYLESSLCIYFKMLRLNPVTKCLPEVGLFLKDRVNYIFFKKKKENSTINS